MADAGICADGDRLGIVLQNLFSNAVKHAGPAVTVRVDATDEGFYVEDDGPGVPADERESIFDPGYTATEDGPGFGLAIVKEIVDAHGWEIAVSESAEGGARFEITGIETVD